MVAARVLQVAKISSSGILEKKCDESKLTAKKIVNLPLKTIVWSFLNSNQYVIYLLSDGNIQLTFNGLRILKHCVGFNFYI